MALMIFSFSLEVQNHLAIIFVQKPFMYFLKSHTNHPFFCSDDGFVLLTLNFRLFLLTRTLTRSSLFVTISSSFSSLIYTSFLLYPRSRHSHRFRA